MPAPTPFPLSISMVLPAFNEEENIVEAARQCLEFATKRFRAAEVIVVDDGSKDDTAKVVTELARDWPQLKLISFAQNRGYGAAIAAGFRAATSDLVFFTDADLQFDVRELADLVPLIGEADAVMVAREMLRDPHFALRAAAELGVAVDYVPKQYLRAPYPGPSAS